MTKLKIIECSEYVCGIYIAQYSAEKKEISNRKFLGTGFFVTGDGLAITAAHVIPEPESMALGQVIVCTYKINGGGAVSFLEYSHQIPGFDCAMAKFFDAPTKCLPIDPAPITMGTDVELLGISEHETGPPGIKQMRIFKGYVVLSTEKRLELNFSVPSGMSGAPLLMHNCIVGLATGRVISEELEEQTEEVEEISNGKEVIRITLSKRITYYGVAIPFSAIAHVPLNGDGSETLLDVITAYRNWGSC